MAGYRKLPSGKWQATVYVPIKGTTGRRLRRTKTHPLKSVVQTWARELEATVDAGSWSTTAKDDLTLGEYRAAWVQSRIADPATRRKNDSQWRTHIEPAWGGYPMSLIARPAIKEWVHRMHALQCARCRLYPTVTASGVLSRHKVPTGRVCSGSGAQPGLGAWTVQGAAAHLSGLLSAAVEDGLLPANPALKLSLPTPPPRGIFYWTRDEAARIVLELGGADALAVDLDMHIGLRPGELFGMRREAVDLDSWLIHVRGVATRSGWRAHAKTSKSHRAVPIPKHLRDQFAMRLAAVGPGELVFPAPDGGAWNDRNFAQRVFAPAVARAGVRSGTPYDMRHTAASWLVQAGVSLYDVQRLLGHERITTTQRYAHLAPGEFGSVLDAWSATSPIDPRAASVPHEPIGEPGRT